jgi:hypothetical protein
MATNLIKKGALTLEDNTISIFDHKGYIDGKYWVMNVFAGLFAKVAPAPVHGDISEIINQDIVDGNFEKIERVLISPNVAVRMYLEGMINRNHIKEAEFFDTKVIFHNISFNTTDGNKLIDVEVIERPENTITTIDEMGKIV